MRFKQIEKEFKLSQLIIPMHLAGLLFLSQIILWQMPAKAQEITVLWDANSEPDLGGYKIYYGDHSRHYQNVVDVGNYTEHTFIPYSGGGTIYFAVTAYDTLGNESAYSVEVTTWSIGNTNNAFSLMPNYPNPFNPITNIPYFIRDRVNVKLAIYDILGREVKMLEDNEKDPGFYESVWDGRDNSGRPTANGVYFCRLIVGVFCHTKKLILTR